MCNSAPAHSARPTPITTHRWFNEFKTIIFLGNRRNERNERRNILSGCFVHEMQQRIFAHMIACQSRIMHFIFFGFRQSFCCFMVKTVCPHRVRGQHIDLVIPIIDYTSLFVTGGLSSARKRRFDLHLMNTEDWAPVFFNPGCWPVIPLKFPHPKSRIVVTTAERLVVSMNQNISEMSESHAQYVPLLCPRRARL
jgi:hypothetical protein